MTVYELPEITSNGWWVSGRIWRFARLGSVLYSIRTAASNRGGVFPSRFCGAGVPVEVGVEDAASGTICVVGAARLEPLAKLAAIFRAPECEEAFEGRRLALRAGKLRSSVRWWSLTLCAGLSVRSRSSGRGSAIRNGTACVPGGRYRDAAGVGICAGASTWP